LQPTHENRSQERMEATDGPHASLFCSGSMIRFNRHL